MKCTYVSSLKTFVLFWTRSLKSIFSFFIQKFVKTLVFVGKKSQNLFEIAGVEIAENFLTGHKFTNLLSWPNIKSILWPWFTLREKFWFFSFLDRRKMSFPYLKGKLALLEKASKWNYLFLKKHQKLFTSQIFCLCKCSIYSHFMFELKKQYHINGIQNSYNDKTYNTTIASFTGLFLTVVRFNLLEW